MSENEDVPYRIVTHRSQIKPPKPPRKELAVVPEMEVDDGEGGTIAAAFLVYQMTAGQIQKHQRNLRSYNPDGTWVPDDTDWQPKLLSLAVRDNHGKPLWKSPEEAIEELGEHYQSALTKMLVAYDKANGVAKVDNATAEEVVEGNSGGTPTESSPSD